MKKRLIIGIGGTGKTILYHLKKSLENINPELINENEFLLIDTKKYESLINDEMFSLIQIKNNDADIEYYELTETEIKEQILKGIETKKEEITNLISSAEDVVLITGLGGRAGSFITPILIEWCKEQNILCSFYCNTPLNFEHNSYFKRAYQALATIYSSLDSNLIFVYSLNDVATNDGVALDRFFDNANNIIVTQIHIFIFEFYKITDRVIEYEIEELKKINSELKETGTVRPFDMTAAFRMGLLHNIQVENLDNFRQEIDWEGPFRKYFHKKIIHSLRNVKPNDFYDASHFYYRMMELKDAYQQELLKRLSYPKILYIDQEYFRNIYGEEVSIVREHKNIENDNIKLTEENIAQLKLLNDKLAAIEIKFLKEAEMLHNYAKQFEYEEFDFEIDLKIIYYSKELEAIADVEQGNPLLEDYPHIFYFRKMTEQEKKEKEEFRTENWKETSCHFTQKLDFKFCYSFHELVYHDYLSLEKILMIDRMDVEYEIKVQDFKKIKN